MVATELVSVGVVSAVGTAAPWWFPPLGSPPHGGLRRWGNIAVPVAPRAWRERSEVGSEIKRLAS